MFAMTLRLSLCWLASISVITGEAHVHHGGGGQQEFVSHGTPDLSRDAGYVDESGHSRAFADERASEFASMSPKEAKESLKKLLPRMDRNDDGVIQRVELKQWITRAYAAMDKEDALRRLKDCDSNNDDKLTWEEHYSCEFGDLDSSEKSEDEKNEDMRMIEEDKDLFAAADMDNDGVLLAETEYVHFVYPESSETMQQAVVSHILLRKDINGDGKIQFDEYIGPEAKSRSKEWIDDEKRTYDHTLDSDGDGVLDEKEIRNWMIPEPTDIAEDEVNHLMSGADNDNDGSLTFDEILDEYDLFVGSEATTAGFKDIKHDEL